MASDHTPTTEQVREDEVAQVVELTRVFRGQVSFVDRVQFANLILDSAWLREHDAERWDEGFTAADHWNGAPLDEGGQPVPDNPYRDPEPVECEHCGGSGNTKVHVKGATVDAPCTPCGGDGVVEREP